jgi:hypothetical protein
MQSQNRSLGFSRTTTACIHSKNEQKATAAELPHGRIHKRLLSATKQPGRLQSLCFILFTGAKQVGEFWYIFLFREHAYHAWGRQRCEKKAKSKPASLSLRRQQQGFRVVH